MIDYTEYLLTNMLKLIHVAIKKAAEVPQVNLVVFVKTVSGILEKIVTLCEESRNR